LIRSVFLISVSQIDLHGSVFKMHHILFKVSYGNENRGAGTVCVQQRLQFVIYRMKLGKILLGTFSVQIHETQQNAFGKDSVPFKKGFDFIAEVQIFRQVPDAGDKNHVKDSHLMNAVQESGKGSEDEYVEEKGIAPYRQLFLINPAAFQNFIYPDVGFFLRCVRMISERVNAESVF